MSTERELLLETDDECLLAESQGGRRQNSRVEDVDMLPPGSSRMPDVRRQVDGVMGIMQNNLAKVLDREARLDTLQDRSEMLSAHSEEFRLSSRDLSREMWWKNAKTFIFIAVLCGIVLFVIFFAIVNKTQQGSDEG